MIASIEAVASETDDEAGADGRIGPGGNYYGRHNNLMAHIIRWLR